ncbi:DUF389 domain-containing protein [bacterium]|nr:DUF389 domain-containing protein [bacterium]
MVIAPLLGPNVGLSLATMLSDIKLAKKAFLSNISGLILVALISIILGTIFKVDPYDLEIFSRTLVGLSDIAIALATGAAGALAYTTGIPTMFVGVTVSVALLPPLVVFGLLLGSGNFDLALGSFFL